MSQIVEDSPPSYMQVYYKPETPHEWMAEVQYCLWTGQRADAANILLRLARECISESEEQQPTTKEHVYEAGTPYG